MAQNSMEPKGTPMPYWEEPAGKPEEKIQEKEYILDDNNWKVTSGPQKTPMDNKSRSVSTMDTMDNSGSNNNNNSMDDNSMAVPYALAMAYVPRQRWGELYTVEVGFRRGTIFPGLDKPFIGEGAQS